MTEEAAPPRARFVRQFALTKGRARSIGVDLGFDTLVRITDRGIDQHGTLPTDQGRIAELSHTTVSIAELGAHLHLHLGIVRVLVSDMVAHELVAISSSDFDESGPDLGTLERLLDDLQAL